MLADVVNRTDVGMIESGGGAGLTFESRNPDRILTERVWQNLNRNLAPQLLVLRAIHLSHAAFSKDREDFIVPERCARLNHQLIELRMGRNVNVKAVLARWTISPPIAVVATRTQFIHNMR
jgi:hypothetical protein